MNKPPKLGNVPIFSDIATTSAANKSLVLLGVSIFTGLLLSGLSTVLFRVIEAYYFIPKPVAGWLRKRQYRHEEALRGKLKELQLQRESRQQIPDTSAESLEDKVSPYRYPRSAKSPLSNESQTGIDVKIGLIRERLRRYPTDARQLGPTRFANALRAIETYGWDRYRLDSQTLWSELMSAVPDSLRAEEGNARTPINFSVSMMYLSGLLGIACLAVGFSVAGSPIAPIALGIISLLLVPAWYRLAVLNTRYLSSVVQAIVNIGRVELAKNMGLVVPQKLQDERDMWERIFWFVDERFDEKYVSDLNSYRSEKKENGQS